MTIFFDGWEGLARIAISAPIIYFAIVLFIRLSGKRSTSQMNNFDWIVTVALGSLVGSGIILKDITVLESLTSIGVLLLLQWALTKTIYHNKHVANLVKAEPVVLASEGVMNRNAMRRERVTESELMAAVRDNGLVSLDQVRWIILETDATMNVIPTADIDIDAPEYLQKLEGFGHQPQAHPPG